jgi:hypothetical protein
VSEGDLLVPPFRDLIFQKFLLEPSREKKNRKKKKSKEFFSSSFFAQTFFTKNRFFGLFFSFGLWQSYL